MLNGMQKIEIFFMNSSFDDAFFIYSLPEITRTVCAQMNLSKMKDLIRSPYHDLVHVPELMNLPLPTKIGEMDITTGTVELAETLIRKKNRHLVVIREKPSTLEVDRTDLGICQSLNGAISLFKSQELISEKAFKWVFACCHDQIRGRNLLDTFCNPARRVAGKIEVRVVLKEIRQLLYVDDPCIEIMDCANISALNKGGDCVDKEGSKSRIDRLSQIGFKVPDKCFRRSQWVRV